MRFTNSPYEDFMKEKSYFKGVPPNLPPKGSRCDGCPYWHGIGCVFCYREQLQGQRQGANMSRELTRQEKAAIRTLVVSGGAPTTIKTMAACRWTAPAICWGSAGRALIAAISALRCCPLIPCWKGRWPRSVSRKPGLVRCAAGLSSRTGGSGTAPRPVPVPQGGRSSAAICGNTGGRP